MLGLKLGEIEGEMEDETLNEGDTDGDIDCEILGEILGEIDGDILGLIEVEGEALELIDGLIEEDFDGDLEGESDGLAEIAVYKDKTSSSVKFLLNIAKSSIIPENLSPPVSEAPKLLAVVVAPPEYD